MGYPSSDDDVSIPRLIARGAVLWPDRAYLLDGERQLTFSEVDQVSDHLALGLKALGVRQGDRVCTILDTGIEAVLIWFAINKLGAISAPVNTNYVGEYLRHQVDDCGASLVIAESDYLDRLTVMADGLRRVAHVVHHGTAPTHLPWNFSSFEDLYEQPREPLPEIEARPSDLAIIIYTSGTTGPSKGCMIGHKYAHRHARNMIWAHGLREGDVVWMPLPLFHLTGCCGLTLAALIQGATVDLVHKFSVSNFWAEIERNGANFVLAMGSMLPLIANAPDNDARIRCFGQVRTVCGAPLDDMLVGMWKKRFGVTVMGSPGYGFTEASIVTRHRLGDSQPEGSSGKRFEDYDVRIFDEAGWECPPGVAGEVVIRPMEPDIIFGGYWNRPESTLAATRDLWLHTGDIGKFDTDGFFYFVDRKKDYLRKGGENISSIEMEAVFRQHLDIEDVAIHAVPSQLAEDDVKASIVLKQGAATDALQLCRWAIERIPAFAVPRYIEFRDTLPRTPNGKVQKSELRAEGITTATWDRERSEVAARPPEPAMG